MLEKFTQAVRQVITVKLAPRGHTGESFLLRIMAIDYDVILQELGQFGTYQKYIYILFGYMGFVLSLNAMSYVFTAGDLRYRCHIEECDKPGTEFQPAWLKNAVPMEYQKEEVVPSRCYRYQQANSTLMEHDNSSCPSAWFLNSTERCYHWVYEGPEETILSEWDLACDEVGWRLSLVGTVHAIAYLLSVPIVGYISDRFGRRNALLVTLILSTVVGVARSFAQSYVQFIILEGLSVLIGSGAYATTFILALEMVGADKRVMGGTIIHLMDALGFASLGVLAWLIPNWRTLIQVMHITGIFFVAYFWFLPESVRWLLVKGRFQEAKEIIFEIARINKVNLSEATLNELDDSKFIPVKNIADDDEETLLGSLREVFRSRILLLRLLNCCFCWATNTFVYYGLALNSVYLGGNKYVNYILTTLIDLPGFTLSYVAMNTIGRKRTIAASLVAAGLACLAFICVPPDMPGFILTLFLLGKLAISVSFSTLYAFTAEIFPTSIRNSLLGTCSMVGRIGTILATQTPSLGRYMGALPPILFGTVSIIGGVLALYFPETKGTKLPDSVKASMELSSNCEHH
ncbi:organic cation transporter protein [Anabrus simplex]|uniref:organic cation transporter protein n=1 Tax=Anabrus simplex TaxID=316456 RepID=UPI0035A2E65B